MPRFFFNVADGHDVPDLQGTALPDLNAARREALRYASALLADRSDIFWSTGEWTMWVTDEDGLALFNLAFLATDAPVLKQ